MFFTLFYATCKRLKKIKLVQFIALVFMFYRTSHWLKNAALPDIKRDMILFMRDCCIVGLQTINWWVPRCQAPDRPIDIEALIPQARQAAYLERHKNGQ